MDLDKVLKPDTGMEKDLLQLGWVWYHNPGAHKLERNNRTGPGSGSGVRFLQYRPADLHRDNLPQ